MKKILVDFKENALSRDEMKNVVGGTLYRCDCNGEGSWIHNYSGPGTATNAIKTYCSKGGTCVAIQK